MMSISQGQRSVRDNANQFETLLGRLDPYNEGLMLNQFIWGLQPDLARSVSLHYPKTIAKAVLLAETTEIAVKACVDPIGRRILAIRIGPHRIKIRGEVHGVVLAEEIEVVKLGILVGLVEDEAVLVDTKEEVDEAALDQ